MEVGISKEECLRAFVYTNVKRGNWEGVVDKYAEYPEAHGLGLTRNDDTALHLAVFDNQEQTVTKLLGHMCRFGNQKHVGIKNKRGNTALHVAASLGSANMCHDIASVDPKLVDDRNEDGETPLFLAALRSHKKAFKCLYHYCSSDLGRVSSNCRSRNGDSALHCALRNDQLDLAFQILSVNKDAATWVNGEGFTPLQVLASKPTAFRSGAYIKGWRNIVYYGTFVDKLKSAPARAHPRGCKTMSQKIKAPPYPENYDTCLYFIRKLWDGFLIISTLKRLIEKKNNTDLEKGIDDKESENCDADQSTIKPWTKFFPENYSTCIDFFRIILKGVFIFLGFGSNEITKIQHKKERHIWSIQVMEKLLESTSADKYFDDGNTPMDSKGQSNSEGETETETETLPYAVEGDGHVGFKNTDVDNPQTGDPKKKDNPPLPLAGTQKESAMLLAAKNGVVEMVRKLFEHFPMAIHDTNLEKKNAVLLAAEFRQPDVYNFLLQKKYQIESVFRAVDDKGNSALHLAANVTAHKPWRITGAALQMQWEVKWYRFVKESVPLNFFARYNKEETLAKTIFHDSHKEMVESGSKWLINTSESCSVVAALITTVAFATATTIPGGSGEEGVPPLENQLGFIIFALSSLVALCLSSTSVITFLGILTSRFDDKDFRSNLPWKLLIGLSSLFFSIVAMLVSFCAGHFFLLHHRLQNMALLVYTAVSLPVATFYAVAQLPLYYDLLLAIVKRVPKRCATVVTKDKPADQNACACKPTTTPHKCCKCKPE